MASIVSRTTPSRSPSQELWSPARSATTRDPASWLPTPGSIDENGRFRLRFRVQTDPEEFVLSGELIASNEISLGDRVMATGRVVSGRHAGRAFTIWVPAYALSPVLALSVLQSIRSQGYPLPPLSNLPE